MKNLYMKYCIGKQQKAGLPDDILRNIASKLNCYSTKKTIRLAGKIFRDMETSSLRTRSKMYEPFEKDASKFDEIQVNFDHQIDTLDTRSSSSFLKIAKLLEDKLLEDINVLIQKENYPKKMYWQNGDIFKTKRGEVYRNDHKFIWYKKKEKLVPLDFEMDEYGCVPKEFALGLEGNENIKNTHWWEDTIDHNRYIPVNFTPAALVQIKNSKKSKIFRNSILKFDLLNIKFNFHVKFYEKEYLNKLQSGVTNYFEFKSNDENGLYYMNEDDYEFDIPEELDSDIL